MNGDKLSLLYQKSAKIEEWAKNVRKSIITDEDYEEILNATLEYYIKIEPYCDKYAETKNDISPENMTVNDFICGDISGLSNNVR